MTSHRDPELSALVSYKETLDRFQDALGSIREISEFISTNRQAIEPEWRATIEIESTSVQGIPSARTRGAVAALGEHLQNLLKIGKEFDNAKESPEIRSARKAAVAELSNQLEAKFRDLSDETFDAASYAHQMLSVSAPRRRTEVLHSSLLTSAVADFEVLFSQVVGMYFSLRPQALSSRELQFSWDDIQQFDSIDELRSFHADRQVEQLMWKGFEEWMEWLEKKLKIKLSEIAMDSDVVKEVFQRRHVIIHNGGHVSRQYLKKAPSAPSTLKIGDKLHVTKEYLESSLDQLFTLGVMMLSAAFFKLVNTKGVLDKAEERLASLTHKMLVDKQWAPALQIAKASAALVRTDGARMALQINLWAAQKKLNGLKSIQRDVEAWDTSTLRGDYAMSRYALLDNFEESWKLATKLLATGEINRKLIEELAVLVDDEVELMTRLTSEIGPAD